MHLPLFNGWCHMARNAHDDDNNNNNNNWMQITASDQSIVKQSLYGERL